MPKVRIISEIFDDDDPYLLLTLETNEKIFLKKRGRRLKNKLEEKKERKKTQKRGKSFLD